MMIARFEAALKLKNIEDQERIFDEVGDMEGDAHDDVLCQLLAACVAPAESKTAAAVSRLLELGANPVYILSPDERELSGMRMGMVASHSTPLAIAIEFGRGDLAKQFFLAASQDCEGAGGFTSVPDVGVIGTLDPECRFPMNALGYAISCGQTEIFKELLAMLDLSADAVRQAMGQTIDDLIWAELFKQAPDSVLGDIVTLIGSGALLSNSTKVSLVMQSIRLDNGLDATRTGPWKSLPFAAMCTLATTPSAGASSAAVITTLRRLRDECNLDLKKIASPDFPGATLLHFAAVLGAPSVVNALLEMGLSGLATDESGRTPIDVARLAGNKAALDLLFFECSLDLSNELGKDIGAGDAYYDMAPNALIASPYVAPQQVNTQEMVMSAMSALPVEAAPDNLPAPAQVQAKKAGFDMFAQLKNRQAAALGKRPDELPVIESKTRKVQAGFV
jgi:ankyrin repeat protein